MASIPEKLKELLHGFMQLFSSDDFKGKDYKSKLLDLASDDEEREDLQELFASTAEYYAEREAILKSQMPAPDYLLNLYMTTWKEEHPDASESEVKEVLKEYENILSEGVIKELENLKNDSQDISEILEDGMTEPGGYNSGGYKDN